MPKQKLRPTYTFDEDRLAALKAVLPEAFADGQINWDTLRDLLGDRLEDEGNDAEHFGLTWPGKRQSRRLAGQPSKGTLIPAPGEGVDEANTRNLFIEGDNLEVLKLLQKSYAGRVKMIYIDPPYNTGNDFVYPDDYSEPLESYLKRTGQMGEGGEMLTTNPKSDGRFHSNWLNMMYPRLRLARNLLSEDGVMFVSVDDNETHNLKLIMDEVFGGEMFVADIAVVNNLKGRSDRSHIATAHEHLLMYVMDEFESGGLVLDDKKLAEYNQVDERGRKFQWRDLRKRGGADSREVRPNLFFPIYLNEQDGTLSLEPRENYTLTIFPKKSDNSDGCWRWGKQKVAGQLYNLKATQVRNSDRWNISYRVFLEVEGQQRTSTPKSVWIGSQYSTDLGQRALKKSLPGVDFGSAPKAVGFIKEILQQSCNQDDICLDFFAGTCTTAQAVLELNREDDGNRHFIMVQLPEPTDNPDYPTIADIGKERIRRVIAQLKQEDKGKLALSTRETPEDLGFKVFKLARSNFKPWDAYEGEDTPQLELRFDEAETPLVPGWQTPDLLTEVILQQGFPLDSVVTPLAQFKANHIVAVESDFLDYRLVVCLDRAISDATTESLTLAPEDIFVCLDSALSDQAKARLSDICNLNVI